MANIKSAKKRVLVNERRANENKSVRSRMNNKIKEFNEIISKSDVEGAKKLLPEVISAIDHAVTCGIIHKNNASNKKAKVNKTLHQLEAGKLVIKLDPKQAKKQEQKAAAAKKAEAKAAELQALKDAKAKRDAEKATKSEEKKESKKGGIKKLAEKLSKPKKEDK